MAMSCSSVTRCDFESTDTYASLGSAPVYRLTRASSRPSARLQREHRARRDGRAPPAAYPRALGLACFSSRVLISWWLVRG